MTSKLYSYFKLIIVILSVVLIVFRYTITEEEKNIIFMGWVNVVTLSLSISLFLFQLYESLIFEHKRMCKKMNKTYKLNNWLKKWYVSIFVMVISISVILLIILVTGQKSRTAFLNDIYTIISLGLALTTDAIPKGIAILIYKYKAV